MGPEGEARRPPVAPEGELRVTLARREGRVAGCRIASTRPDVARLLLQGRRPNEVNAALPRLFSICGQSQAVAGALALAAAAGHAPSEAELAEAGARVAAESRRELVHRMLLDWPRLLGETPAADAVPAVRAARAADLDAVAAAQVAAAVFGMPAERWLGLQDEAAFSAWVAAGETVAARFVQRAAAQAEAAGAPLLDGPMLAADPAAWAAAAESDPAFVRAPAWQGGAAETGPLARRRDDPLLLALAGGSLPQGARRAVARLRELACQLAGRTGRPLAGSCRIEAGASSPVGLGWVENARGLLVHLARLAEGSVAMYRIVAPTDWNFHPQGALAPALLGLPAGDDAELQRRAALAVASLDPCVECRVELADA